MRSYLKPLLGGVLALLVALSASPALAVTTPPVDPIQDTSLQEPGTDTELTDPAAETEEPGTEEPGTEEPGGEAPETVDPGVEEPLVPETPGADEGSEPETEQPGTVEDLDAAEPSEEDPAEVDPALLTEAPATLPVSGTIAVIAEEGPQLMRAAVEDQELLAEDSEMTAGGVVVATDAGPIVALAPEQVPADVETGDRFEGELTLHAEARAAVEAEIAADGPVTVAEAIETVELENAAGDAPAAPVTGAALSGAAAGGPVTSAVTTSKVHPVDMVFFTGGGKPADDDLRQLVADSGSYWKTQTNGKLSGLTLNYKGKFAPKRNSKKLRCSADGVNDMWGQAAAKFGRSANSYLTSGRHLVVVVDDNCGAASNDVAGLGTYGKTLHSGGMVWVDIGQRGGGAVNRATGLFAHEIGHNLSLGHGNTRVCSGSATDSKHNSAGRPVSPCWDVEYGDVFNVMGFGSSVGGAKPPALAISQKYNLGVAPSGSVKTVKASGGRSQTFTLQPGSKTSGLRGLRVESPTGGAYFVEYRNMTGQDAGLGMTPTSWKYVDSGGVRTFVQNQGVRVMRTHTTAYSKQQNIRTSTAISVRDTVNGRAGLNQTMRAGKNSTPWNSTARVTVLSTGATAKVRVDFTPFVDVPYAHKFAKEINWMNSAKLSPGISAGGSLRKYSPKGTVTRETMAAFLYRLEAPAGYKPPAKSPFRDVPKNHKFYKEISWMYTTGLSTGIRTSTGRNYAPKAAVTRGSMAAFIYRLEGAKYPGAAKSPFVDVKKGQKFYKEITWMYNTGLSTGTVSQGKRSYHPNTKVSREVMAAFIYRLKH